MVRAQALSLIFSLHGKIRPPPNIMSYPTRLKIDFYFIFQVRVDTVPDYEFHETEGGKYIDLRDRNGHREGVKLIFVNKNKAIRLIGQTLSESQLASVSDSFDWMFFYASGFESPSPIFIGKNKNKM